MVGKPNKMYVFKRGKFILVGLIIINFFVLILITVIETLQMVAKKRFILIKLRREFKSYVMG